MPNSSTPYPELPDKQDGPTMTTEGVLDSRFERMDVSLTWTLVNVQLKPMQMGRMCMLSGENNYSASEALEHIGLISAISEDYR